MNKFTICVVCKSLNKDPQRLKNCNHLVCLECVTKVKKEGTWRCPFCNEIVVKCKLDLVIKEIVDELLNAMQPCSIHPNEQYFMVCEQCIEPVCRNCVMESHNGHKFIGSDNPDLIKSIKEKITIEIQQSTSTAEQLQEALDEINRIKPIHASTKEKQMEQITLKHSLLHKLFQIGDFRLKKPLDLNNDIVQFTFDEYSNHLTSKLENLTKIKDFKVDDDNFNLYTAVSLLNGVKSIKALISEYKREKEHIESTYENKYYYNQDVAIQIIDLYKKLFVSYRCYCNDSTSINECRCYFNQINSDPAKTNIMPTSNPSTPTTTTTTTTTTTSYSNQPSTTAASNPSLSSMTDPPTTTFSASYFEIQSNKIEQSEAATIFTSGIPIRQTKEQLSNIANEKAMKQSAEIALGTHTPDGNKNNNNNNNEPSKKNPVITEPSKPLVISESSKPLVISESAKPFVITEPVKDQEPEVGIEDNGNTKIIRLPARSPDNRIKKIKSLYFLCGMEDKLHLSRCVKYNPITDEWIFMPPSKHKRACVTSAAVIVDHMIYLFGGNDSLESYEKFNTISNRWESSGNCNIANGGGSSMSACYDSKNKCIYLVGGVKFNQTSMKIERCIINTKGDWSLSFEMVASLKFPRYYCFTVIHNDLLYVIGGTNKTRDEAYFSIINNIEVLDLKSGSNTETWLLCENLDSNNNRIEGVCFDGVSKFYIITIESFFTFNIYTGKKHKLTYPPIQNMRFGFSISIGHSEKEGSNIIYLVGDRGTSHFRYNISSCSWDTANSKRPISSYFHAAVPEYETTSTSAK